MNTIRVNIQSTLERLATQLDIDFYDFDPHNGVSFLCTFSKNNFIVDRIVIKLDDDAWQNWPTYETSEEDYNYIKQYILNALNLTEV